MTPPNVYHTRVAPSPTGPAHLGTMRTFLFNMLAARASGGTVLLRIDDTDIVRSREKYVYDLMQSLDYMGFYPDKVVRQSERLDRHLEIAKGLLDAGGAYAEGDAIRLDVPCTMKSWTDNIVGEVNLSDDDRIRSDNLVLIKSDGSPTYHFASILDDYDLGINHVIRGIDHLSNTPKQLHILEQIKTLLSDSGPNPSFSHVGLIMLNKKKMSKRDPVASFSHMMEAKIKPDAIYNFMLRMGWGPREDNKANSVLTRDRALELFLDGGRMRSSPANYDEAKLAWFNKKCA